jgi:predicted ABC-type transport system involved in lysophospholipase L1 biosynthesis ATPase subunit
LDRLAPAIFETGGTMTLVVMTWRRELIDRCDRTLTLSDHEAYPMPVSKGGH